jgi:hypothetical protein
MATKRQVQLLSIQGVVQGQTATVTVPSGPRYHSITLQAKAATKTGAQIISEVRVKINGKTQRVHTYTELNALNLLNGAIYAEYQPTAGAGNDYFITLFFAEPWRVRQDMREGLAWGTGDVGTFQLEVDINATAGATITLLAWAEVDNSTGPDGKAAGLGLVSKWYRTLIPVAGTSVNFWSLPRKQAYQQISFFDSFITRVQVVLDSIIIRDVTKAQNDARLVASGMTPVAGRFDLVFDHDDILANALPMEIGANRAQDFQLNLTLSDGTARNIATIYQILGQPD